MRGETFLWNRFGLVLKTAKPNLLLATFEGNFLHFYRKKKPRDLCIMTLFVAIIFDFLDRNLFTFFRVGGTTFITQEYIASA